MGPRTGVASLYRRRMDHIDPSLDRFNALGTPVYVADHALQIASHALQIASTKHASFAYREHFRSIRCVTGRVVSRAHVVVGADL
ncbi:hypothetical protein AB4Y72_09550 [Arthrobacter sp. YAF34]|uniref:hypothetical protein n=1 Tax=Arthrobacter sp. YAF34 TaxID=3233083 RepID=UPI003F909618